MSDTERFLNTVAMESRSIMDYEDDLAKIVGERFVKSFILDQDLLATLNSNSDFDLSLPETEIVPGRSRDEFSKRLSVWTSIRQEILYDQIRILEKYYAYEGVALDEISDYVGKVTRFSYSTAAIETIHLSWTTIVAIHAEMIKIGFLEYGLLLIRKIRGAGLEELKAEFTGLQRDIATLKSQLNETLVKAVGEATWSALADSAIVGITATNPPLGVLLWLLNSYLKQAATKDLGLNVDELHTKSLKIEAYRIRGMLATVKTEGERAAYVVSNGKTHIKVIKAAKGLKKGLGVIGTVLDATEGVEIGKILSKARERYTKIESILNERLPIYEEIDRMAKIFHKKAVMHIKNLEDIKKVLDEMIKSVDEVDKNYNLL